MKLNSGARSIFYNVAFLGLVLGIQACGGGSAPNAAPTAGAVSITDDNGGTIVVGDNLTATYTYADAENNAEGTTTFIWLRDGAAISGATASTYSLVAADSETSITLSVTPIASTGTTTGTAVVSTGVAVVNSAPTASSVSVVDDNGGTAVFGDNLTGSYTYNDVDGNAEGTSTYRWLRGGVAISGATAVTYTLVLADIGQSISFEVTPIAAAGTTTGSLVVSSTVVPNANPTGYYNTGTHTELGFSDLQALVSGNRLLIMSNGDSLAPGSNLFYDGQMSISGSSFTANLTVYTNSLSPISVTATGSIVDGSSITGVISGGGVTVDGTFNLSFASTNNEASDIVNIDQLWAGSFTLIDAFEIDATGQLTRFEDFPINTTFIANCTVSSGTSIVPIASTRLYSVSFTLSGCTNNTNVIGNYTGLATSYSATNPDDHFVLMVSNANELVGFADDMEP